MACRRRKVNAMHGRDPGMMFLIRYSEFIRNRCNLHAWLGHFTSWALGVRFMRCLLLWIEVMKSVSCRRRSKGDGERAPRRIWSPLSVLFPRMFEAWKTSSPSYVFRLVLTSIAISEFCYAHRNPRQPHQMTRIHRHPIYVLCSFGSDVHAVRVTRGGKRAFVGCEMKVEMRRRLMKSLSRSRWQASPESNLLIVRVQGKVPAWKKNLSAEIL